MVLENEAQLIRELELGLQVIYSKIPLEMQSEENPWYEKFSAVLHAL
jgi:hypothetical protein